LGFSCFSKLNDIILYLLEEAMRRGFQKALTKRLQGEPLPPWSLFGFHPGTDNRHDIFHDQDCGELGR
jgi:hypothetical protein